MKGVKQKIFRHIKDSYPNWVLNSELQKMDWGHLPDYISRQARKLREEMPHRIERGEVGDKKMVKYRYIQSEYEKLHQARLTGLW